MEGDLQNRAMVSFAGSQQKVVGVKKAVVGLVTDNTQVSISGPRAGQLHIAFMYVNDLDARTEDPVQMGENYRVPVMLPANGEECLIGYSPADTYSELIVSPRYAKTFGGKRYEKHLQDLEIYKGKYRVFPDGKLDRIIYRKTDFKLPSRSILKSNLPIRIKIKTLESGKRKKEDSVQTNDVSNFNKDKQTVMLECGNGSESIVKITFNGIDATVCLTSLKRLISPNMYLNDEIINYFMLKCLKLLYGPAINPDYEFIYCPTYTWQACIFHQLGNALAARKQKSLYNIATGHGTQPNLLKKKFLILPVAREDHWFLVIVCRPFPAEQLVNKVLHGTPYNQCTVEQAQKIYQKWLDGDVCNDGGGNHIQKPKMLFFDSMAVKMDRTCVNYSSIWENTSKYVNRALFTLHQKFWEANESKELAIMAAHNTNFSIGHREVKVPGQSNTVDCGIFCVAYVLAWLNVTGQHGIEYTDAEEMNFALLFSHVDLEGERVKMFNDIKKDISLDLQHLVERLRSIITTRATTSVKLAIKSEPVNYNPMSTPFENLVMLINQRVGVMKLCHEYSSFDVMNPS